MTRIEWARYCAQVWNDCGPLDENDNWIPSGEDSQQFIQLVRSYLPNAGYGSGGGIPSEAEPSAVDYQDDESDDEDGLSEEDEDESDDESDGDFSEEDDESDDEDGLSEEDEDESDEFSEEGPVQGLTFKRSEGPK